MFVFQSLTLVKDKTLAIFQQCLLLFKRSPFWKTSRLPFVPVSILSKLWPSWKTTRLPFVCTRVHSLQILTVLKKETLVVFQISANFFNISPCWKHTLLAFFCWCSVSETSHLTSQQCLCRVFQCPLSSNSHCVERQNACHFFVPVSILFKFSFCWQTKRLPYFEPVSIFFKFSPCWRNVFTSVSISAISHLVEWQSARHCLPVLFSSNSSPVLKTKRLPFSAVSISSNSHFFESLNACRFFSSVHFPSLQGFPSSRLTVQRLCLLRCNI